MANRIVAVVEAKDRRRKDVEEAAEMRRAEEEDFVVQVRGLWNQAVACEDSPMADRIMGELEERLGYLFEKKQRKGWSNTLLMKLMLVAEYDGEEAEA
jgi:hypothetical protein